MSNKYSQKLIDSAKKSTIYSIKTAPQEQFKKPQKKQKNKTKQKTTNYWLIKTSITL